MLCALTVLQKHLQWCLILQHTLKTSFLSLPYWIIHTITFNLYYMSLPQGVLNLFSNSSIAFQLQLFIFPTCPIQMYLNGFKIASTVHYYVHFSLTVSEFSCQYAVTALYTTEFPVYPQTIFFSYSSTNCRSINGKMKMGLFQRPLFKQIVTKIEISSITYIRYLIKMVIPMTGQLGPWHFQGPLFANSHPRNCIKTHRNHKASQVVWQVWLTKELESVVRHVQWQMNTSILDQKSIQNTMAGIKCLQDLNFMRQ
jgi:hypothetical protein